MRDDLRSSVERPRARARRGVPRWRGSEPLTWEAKGTDLPRPDSIAKHACGFANAVDESYLLLGFERNGGGWRATGLDFPCDDPPVWVSAIVRDHLRPAPRVDIRDWPAGPKRAAVVRVEPVAEPPCQTRGGQVYERVSGATVPVGEASDLRRLYERGQAAATRAEASAGRAALAIGIDEETAAPCHLLLGLAVAPVGIPRDIAAHLFTPEFARTLKRLVDELPRGRSTLRASRFNPPARASYRGRMRSSLWSRQRIGGNRGRFELRGTVRALSGCDSCRIVRSSYLSPTRCSHRPSDRWLERW